MIPINPDRRALLATTGALIWPNLAGARPRRKEVLAFYYGWYSLSPQPGQDPHWQGIDTAAKTIADCPDYPQDDPYDSLDPAVIKRQVQQARAAGITGFIASWWGQKDRTDQQFPLLLDAADGLKIAPYIETAANADALTADITYLLKTYGRHRAWLRLNGKPVIFIFDRVIQALGKAGWQAVHARVRGKAAFVGPANNMVEINDRKRNFDALHIYSMQFALSQPHATDPAAMTAFYNDWVAAQKGLKVTTATVLPGYDDHLLPDRTGKRPTVDRAGGQLFQILWRAATGARPDWMLVVSFNEWQEASQVEPSTQFGDRELGTIKAFRKTF